MATSEPLVRVFRGEVEESVHAGSLVVLEGESLVLARGDPDRVVFYRSAAKPFQALEVVRCGAADAFGLSPEELALAAGSHNAEPRHLEVARSILAKAGVPESALRCGGHRSISSDVAFAQRRDEVSLSPILSNCSGKHAAMLAAARHRGEPLDGYLDPAHPLQAAIRANVAAFAGLRAEDVFFGVDGCGAPTPAAPLRAIARSAVRLGSPQHAPAELREAARRVAQAMVAHPEMVAGAGRFDTDLMRASRGRVIAKAGAEGVHMAVAPERALGIAVKVDDGQDRGYRAVVVEILRRFGALDDAAAREVCEKHAHPEVRTVAGARVGRVEVAV